MTADIHYIYSKCVKDSVRQYVLSSNPREGCVSRTFFPPQPLAVKQNNQYLLNEAQRLANYVPRKRKNVILEKLSSVDVDNLSENDLQTMFLFSKTKLNNSSNKVSNVLLGRNSFSTSRHWHENYYTYSGDQIINDDVIKLDPHDKLSKGIRFRKIREKSDMEKRFEATTKYHQQSRINKAICEAMAHRTERYYYLQGAVVPFTKRKSRPALLGSKSNPTYSRNYQDSDLIEESVFLTQAEFNSQNDSVPYNPPVSANDSMIKEIPNEDFIQNTTECQSETETPVEESQDAPPEVSDLCTESQEPDENPNNDACAKEESLPGLDNPIETDDMHGWSRPSAV